ncbi:DUF4134 family protein [Algoriphagus sp. D3-2-R+10]|uniref:DUF4134 family protein n=1 Tax=Algoriphagus aurantiacus TaxID=3103948 RepID=UPI002B3F7BF0|nr:DUF4134 family protein [Algoriphagus sp. D3-2-R+10]MEB2774574.1 DUF4134 family protein [Algoriphagus sp. D3-2-R+10]
MKSIQYLLFSGFFFLFLSNSESFGQSPPGVTEFQEAESDMRKIYVALSQLSFAVGAVSGSLGGLRVYNNWQMGRHHIDVQVISWFSACIFLATIGFFLSGLFGVPLT